MTPRGPRFLDEEGELEQARSGPAPSSGPAVAPWEEAAAGTASAPRGPMLLDPEPKGPARVDVGWAPAVVAVSKPRVGTGFWVATGLCVLLGSWLVLSVAAFVMRLFVLSPGLGFAAMIAIALGGAMLCYAGLLEIRAYRSLSAVEHLRAALTAPTATVEAARGQALLWLGQVALAVPEREAAERMLRGAATVAEVRSVLRSQVADRLREAAGAIGRRAAVEGATLVNLCPHPAWEGMIAGGRGLMVIRSVGILYGLRPGLSVTLRLMRQVAWTAAGTAGLDLLSQGLADHVLNTTPVLKHVAAALPGTGQVAVRLLRLASMAAESCSPVP